MARLPQPGGDQGSWGDILNDYLSQSHNADGTLKPISQSGIQNLVSDLAAKAPSTSPTFSGTVTVPTPSNGTDAATKAYVDSATTGSYAPQTARYLVATGAADESSAIQTVLNAAGADEIVRLYGTFAIGSTVIVKGNLDASGAVFNYSGTGTAVQVGDTTVRSWKQIRLPRVIYLNKPATGSGWTAGTIGVDVINIQSSLIYVPHIKAFETNLRMYSNGQGNVYNTIELGHLDNGKRNLVLASATSAGWTNQNVFVGGRFSMSPSEGQPVAGSAQIYLDPTYGANNNTFINCSLESGSSHEYLLDIQSGSYNQWINCRWEISGGGTANVRWGATTTYNIIKGGYTSYNIVETKVAGATRNWIESPRGTKLFAGGAIAEHEGMILENTGSSGNPVLRVMSAGDDGSQADPVTAYRWSLSGSSMKAKAAADTSPRLQIDSNTGRLYVGPGSSAATAYIDAGTGTAVKVNGDIVSNADNTYDVGATGSNRFRYARLGTGVQVGTFTTAGRPSAATAGAGCMIFDTTLGRPVWSNGTSWVDPVASVSGSGGASPVPNLPSGWWLATGLSYTTNAALSLNNLYAVPMYIPRGGTVTAIGAEFTAASSEATTPVVRLGLFADDTTGRPGTLLADAGTFSVASGTTPGQASLSTSVVVTAGWYWVAAVIQGVTTTPPTMRTNASGMLVGSPTMSGSTSITKTALYVTSVSGAFASSYSGWTSTNGTPKIMIQVT